jgi:hypothetical protein
MPSVKSSSSAAAVASGSSSSSSNSNSKGQKSLFSFFTKTITLPSAAVVVNLPIPSVDHICGSEAQVQVDDKVKSRGATECSADTIDAQVKKRKAVSHSDDDDDGETDRHGNGDVLISTASPSKVSIVTRLNKTGKHRRVIVDDDDDDEEEEEWNGSSSTTKKRVLDSDRQHDGSDESFVVDSSDDGDDCDDGSSDDELFNSDSEEEINNKRHKPTAVKSSTKVPKLPPSSSSAAAAKSHSREKPPLVPTATSAVKTKSAVQNISNSGSNSSSIIQAITPITSRSTHNSLSSPFFASSSAASSSSRYDYNNNYPGNNNNMSTPDSAYISYDTATNTGTTTIQSVTPSPNAMAAMTPSGDNKLVLPEGVVGRGSHEHNSFTFLQPSHRKDKDGHRPNHPDYNHRTLLVPSSFLHDQTPAMAQWWHFKADNMDTVLFFKVGKFYELFHMDADVGFSELDLIYMKGSKAHSGFPEVSYGKFAGALVSKGYRVARVEQTEVGRCSRYLTVFLCC